MPVTGIRERFLDRFGSEPDVLAIAPGRINLIGEHTDYNDGFVFPAAIDRGLLLAASKSANPSEMFSVQLGKGATFDTTQVVPGTVEGWSKYPAGMGWALSNRLGAPLPNLKAVVDSDIPIGSGVSSSAAIELAFGVTWRQLEGLALSNLDLARLGQICENRFVGVNSGIMDQMASGLGHQGHAMFIDIRSLAVEYVAVPDELCVVLCDTKKERALTSSAYNERRSQCEEASKAMGVPALRDASLADLERAKPRLTDLVYRRARHVITENNRCVEFKQALAQGDLQAVGELMRDSHESLRYDYEVSCDELNTMAEAAWSSPGCIGARMTGAGFGGACVALVHSDRVDDFTKSVLSAYNVAYNRESAVIVCNIVDGARVFVAS